MDVTEYEIVNLYVKNNEIWGHLINKNFEKYQQLVAIGPLKELIKKIEATSWNKITNNNFNDNHFILDFLDENNFFSEDII